MEVEYPRMTIWKLKEESSDVPSARIAAGNKQERDVAFYLRRAFKDSDDYIIFNDISLSFNDEKAQIDHLVIHQFGFVIIESKSIYGEVKVNAAGEWSRSYKGQWSGIPSPIKQAQLQSDLLKDMLTANIADILPKVLGLQLTVGGRKWDTLCAVSNSCILHRDNIPKNVNNSVIKSEGVAEAVKALGDKNIFGKVFGGDPILAHSDMISIASFIEHNRLKETTVKIPAASSEHTPQKETKPRVDASTSPKSPKNNAAVLCKRCGESKELDDLYGQYGYYVKCRKCGTNTSMKIACVKCGNKKVKLSKKKQDYYLSCKCCEPYIIFSQSPAN